MTKIMEYSCVPDLNEDGNPTLTLKGFTDKDIVFVRNGSTTTLNNMVVVVQNNKLIMEQIQFVPPHGSTRSCIIKPGVIGERVYITIDLKFEDGNDSTDNTLFLMSIYLPDRENFHKLNISVEEHRMEKIGEYKWRFPLIEPYDNEPLNLA